MSGGPLGPSHASVSIPRGDLVAARVVDGIGGPLRDALERRLTGYLTLETQKTLILDEEEERAVLTFEDGVPVLAYELEADAGGPEALAVLAPLAGEEPVRVKSFQLSAAELAAAHDCEPLSIAPDAPALELADDPDLAARTRAHAPEERCEAEQTHDALAAFLADEERVNAIKREAREEAERRANEWGLAGELTEAEVAD